MAFSRRQLLRISAQTLAGLCIHSGIAHAGPPQLNQVADGVFGFSGTHALMSRGNSGAICNIAVIAGQEAIAVVDSGGSLVEAHAIIAAIGKVSAKPVRYLINTHMHPDHVFGNAAFRDIGATIVGHRNLPLALAGRGEVYLARFRGLLGEQLMQGVEIVPPSVLVDDTVELDLGNRKLELRAWKPAHTDNDLTVLDPQTGTLVAGDLVFSGHVPTLDGSLLGWIGQLDQLAALKAARVIPGHGPIPSPWPGALAAETAYFTVLLRDIRKSIAEGEPMSEAVKTAGQSERSRWQLFDEYNERNATVAFAEVEWE